MLAVGEAVLAVNVREGVTEVDAVAPEGAGDGVGGTCGAPHTPANEPLRPSDAGVQTAETFREPTSTAKPPAAVVTYREPTPGV
jgi:hypothetical protein